VISVTPKEVFAKNLNRLLDKNGKSQADLATYMKTTASTVSDWCNGKKYPRVDKMQKLADYFGVLKSDLTEEYKNELIPIEYNPTHKIPVLGRISAGLPLYAEEHIEGYIYTELNGGNEYFGLRVVGDSMTAARICEGDIIIVRQQEQVEDGEIAVVMVDDNDATVKRFHRNGRTVTLTPQSYNPVHQVQVYDLKQTHIRIIGKVIRVVYDID
jgi:repressor LexA